MSTKKPVNSHSFFQTDIIQTVNMKEQRHTILLGTPLTYSLSYSARARRLRISISDAGVSLVLPQGFSASQGEAFLHKNGEWVMKQLERRDKRSAQGSRALLPADVLLLRGRPTRVERFEEPGLVSRARVEEKSEKLRVYLPAGRSAATPLVLSHWLQHQARREIEAMTLQQSRRMQASFKKITIRDQRTRWGSCSSRGTLSFNWRLIMVPPTVMEYVVIHELAHLSVPNHSADFWRLVSQYYPNHKEARNWLKKNAPLLHPQILQEG